MCILPLIIKMIEKVILFSWHKEQNGSYIGNSFCDNFRIEITPKDNRFVYVIKKGDSIVNSSSFEHKTIEEAKRVSASLIALQKAIH